MSVVKRLQSLKLPEDAMVTLTYEEGTDVFVHNETEVEDAMNEKSVADMSRAKSLKSLFRIVTPHLNLKDIPLIAVNHTYQEI